jgi:hypothetical protein
MTRKALRRGRWWALLIVGVLCAPRVLGRPRRTSPAPLHPTESGAKHPLFEAEPYKIAIAAFYALCVQRIFETTISSLNMSTPRISISSSGVTVDATSHQVVLLCQTLALLIWLGLYFINNVRLYLLVPESALARRTLVHVVLTVALSEFYFLAATTGRPSTNQILLILSIIVIDALYPLILGQVLSLRSRVFWVARGMLQTAGILCILVFVRHSDYGRVGWSAAWLGLMLTQLLVIVPAELHWRRRSRLASPT